MTAPEIPYGDTPYLPEYKALGAIVGHGKLKAEHWPTWARIVAVHGWKAVLRAADYLEPAKRWPAEVETLCRQYELDEAATRRALEDMAGKRPQTTKEEREARAAAFRAARAKEGV